MRQIEQLDSEIMLEIEDDADLDRESNRITDFEDEISEAEARYRFMINHYNTVTNPQPVTPTTTGRASFTPTRRIKLPPLEPPVFNGKYTEWPSFWDKFNVTIHSNPELSDVERLSFLQRGMQGTAARELSGYETTASNYSECLNRLRKLYDANLVDRIFRPVIVGSAETIYVIRSAGVTLLSRATGIDTGDIGDIRLKATKLKPFL